MNEVWLVDLRTNKEFKKTFTDLRKQRVFLLRCWHSKKVMVTCYTYQSESQRLYLSYGL